MASTARSYEPRRRYAEQPNPEIEVHPGRGREAEARVERAVSTFKMVIAVLAVLAVMCVVRVALTNASMDTLTQVSEVNEAIEDAEARNTDLEVEYYTATSATDLKAYASEELGMSAAAVATTTVDLTPEVLEDAVSTTVTGGIAACQSAAAEQVAEQAAED